MYITTIAGTGVAGFSGDGGLATNAQLNLPISIAVDAAGNIYIADAYNYRIRKVDTGGTITTISAGTDGFSGDGSFAKDATLSYINGIVIDANGSVYATSNTRIRKLFIVRE